MGTLLSLRHQGEGEAAGDIVVEGGLYALQFVCIILQNNNIIHFVILTILAVLLRDAVHGMHKCHVEMTGE